MKNPNRVSPRRDGDARVSRTLRGTTSAFCKLFFPVMLASRLLAEPSHPILAIPNVTNSTTLANTILTSWTDADYVGKFVPRQAPRRDDAGFADAVVAGDTSWSWTASNPDKITSKPSNKVFPGAAGYTQLTQTITVLDGSTVAVPYYIAAGTTTQKSFVQALIDHKKTEKLRTDLDALADAYMDSGATHAARNQAYARRIALALYEWGKYVPKYFMTELNNPVLISGGVNYMASANIHRCSARNGFGEELNQRELLAFDAIYDSPALASLSTELGLDVREFIRTNVFGNMGDFFVTHMTPLVASSGTNLPGATQVLAKIARVLNRPDYLPWLDGYFDAVVSNRLNREGTILESLGYSINYIRTVKTAVSDASNYFLTRPADTQVLLDSQSHLTGYSDFLQQGISSFLPISLPNGKFPSFGDTTDQGFFLASTTPKTTNAGSSGVMGAFGALSIGAGTGAGSVQLNQMAAGDENHKRSDTTAFALYVFGNEYLGNIRYFNGSLERQFGEQPIAHNMVTIDRADMSNRSANTDGSGDITLFEPGNNGLAVTEIDGQRIYSAKATRYQRIMMLNTRDLTKPYAVDVFRVTGGQKHEYSLHGAIMFDQSAECSFPLVPSSRTYPLLASDAAWDPPVNQYDNFSFYGMFRNVSTAVAPGDFQITYRETSSATSHRDLRLWMTDGANATVNVGRSPVPAREHVIPPSYFTNGIWRPSTIISRDVATGTLSSLFVSVVEPMKGGVSTVQSVERLPVTGSNLESCAVRVTLTDGRVDTYLVNLRNPEVAGGNTGTATVSTADGKYSLTGRIGAVTEGPSGWRAWSIKATDFTYDNSRLATTDRHYGGTITGETRKATGGANDAFITTTPLPVGTALRGQQLKLTFGTLSSPATAGISEMFAIDQVVQVGGDYHIMFPVDHRLEITNSGATSKEQQLPKRTFSGVNAFEIDLSASTLPIPALADVSMESNTSSDAIPFSFGDLGATPAASLQVAATSSNQTLVPNANLLLNGTGNSRSLVIIPAADQSGTATITVTLTDGKWTSSRSFKLTVTDIRTVTAIASGPINSSATWPVALPTAGDVLTWRTAAFSLNIPFLQTFHGRTLKIDAGGNLTTAGPTLALTLSNLVMNGGTIVIANNNGLGINLGGGKLTLNNGFLKAGSSNNGRDLRFSNGTMSGNGTIQIIGFDNTGSDVELQSSMTTKGFTGLFDVKQFGILNLPPISTNSASFGVILSGTGKYANDANVALTSLVIAGTPVPNGVYTYSSFTPAQQAFFVNTSNSVTITVGPSTNTPPTISNVGDVTTDEDAATPDLGFTIGDAENTTESLTLSGTSSNPLLVPNENINFSGTSANRTAIITPAANQSGTATITLTVSDGGLTATDTFVLNVNGAPGISSFGDVMIDEDAVISALDFDVGDDATPVGSLVLSAHSSNELLVPDGNIVFSGSGTSRSVAISPLANASGTAIITLSVYDGRISSSQSFDLTVAPVDDAPTITPIADQTLSLNSGTGPISFNVGDVDDPASSLEISAASSNTSLVPLGGIVFSGNDGNRTVTITPSLLLSGSSIITMTVSDGTITTSETFVVTVNGFAYLFNSDASFEGWTANSMVTGASVSGGTLSGTLNGADPQFNRTSALNIPGNSVAIVLVRMKSSAGGNAQFFFGNELSGVSAANSVTFPVTPGSVFKWHAVNVAANSNWMGHTIKALRLDPPNTTGIVSIDAIIGSDGDFDHDGINDTWEVGNQLDPSSDVDAPMDPDGDGLNNAAEYVLGTNPTVSNPPSTLALSTSTSEVTMHFLASLADGAGYTGLTRYYDLETSTTLGDPSSWAGVHGYTSIAGAGQSVAVTLPLSTGPRFYRLKVRINP